MSSVRRFGEPSPFALLSWRVADWPPERRASVPSSIASRFSVISAGQAFLAGGVSFRPGASSIG
jgi:hypothetical protein